MAIYESIGFGSLLHPYTGKLDPFDYIANFKPLKPPEGMTIDEFKRTKAPYCISGKVKPENNGSYKRNNSSLVYRDLIFIDYDDITSCSEEFKQTVFNALFGYSYILYPTIKHTPEKPRYRLVVKPSTGMKEDTYKKTVREITDLIGLPYDQTSETWSQLQGLPVTQFEIESYDRVVNRALDYQVTAPAVENVKKQATRGDIKPRSGQLSITMRVINTLLTGLGDEGGRNVALARFVGLLLSKYVNCDVPTAYELAKIANDVTGDPLPQDELETTFESIVKAEIRKRGLGLSN
ncbi:primase alpha helix C-terminal domain-containing protein [Streptococcus uberis]|uniref:primase alpha helix C-terminal domain-containing protein n=1 Tax=Streptococcus uberis TaxID=1349 RepID=UPI001FF32883|nr:primase alpha helix C-terminal domain-containing protein [Streptococcus uberis]MCK1203832.1 primase alpha helix C-terminal domain-containing protein [Streptococcus uberis]MCK1230707.1 primase alpha helix C-terminal domain-containing protein [Streptococcus uberis]